MLNPVQLTLIQPAMKKLTLLFLLLPVFLNAQDIIYTVSGDYNGGKTPFDSIMVDNITNGTSISFSNLPEHDYYQINLTKNAYWGTVSVFDIEEPSSFTLLENSPGNLSIRYGGLNETTIKVSIINVNGQTLYLRNDLVLLPSQFLRVKLGSEGLYFVKIESLLETKTFKAIGSAQETVYAVEVGNGINTKSVSSTTLKSTTLTGEGDFTFEEGDSIRIWGFRKEIYALPKHLKILKSDNINFKFETVYYSTNVEMAYPDSVGVDSIFLVDNDTIFCKKINGEYILQGDIILTEKQLAIAPTKGASTSDLTKLWTDGIVYYKINNSFTDKARVIEAVSHYQNITPLTFKNIDDLSGSNITNYIEFVSTKNKNDSYLGMIGGRQTINIGNTETSGTIIHEIGHAVGLIHEHSRTDRDNYITLNWYNINSNFLFRRNDFRKLYRSKCLGNLDFNSIMIYSSVVKTNSGKEVLVITKLDGTTYKSQRSNLSKGDIKIIEELYGSISKKKPVVATITPSNPTISSMTLMGNISFDGGSSITARGFGWCKAGETVYKLENVNGTTGKFEFTLNNLKPNTEYWIYAFASNSNGTAFGDLRSFRTKGFGTLVYDGRTYKTVIINGKEWMAENLAYLPAVHPPTSESYAEARYYVYGYTGTDVDSAKQQSNYTTYGVLYNWVAAKAACPPGWHLPSSTEMSALRNWVGSAEKMKATSGWSINGNGTNTSGFSALPGGRRDDSDNFNFIGGSGWWWSTLEDNTYKSYAHALYISSGSIIFFGNTLYPKIHGYSVRCVKD